jgi:hypothetical protein
MALNIVRGSVTFCHKVQLANADLSKEHHVLSCHSPIGHPASHCAGNSDSAGDIITEGRSCAHHRNPSGLSYLQ